MTASARETTCAGAEMVGTTSVVPIAEVPDADVTRQAVSRVKRRRIVQVSSGPAVTVPRLTHRPDPYVVPAGAVQTVTRSPGTPVPVSVCRECQADRLGPVTVGGNTGWIATEPETAGP